MNTKRSLKTSKRKSPQPANRPASPKGGQERKKIEIQLEGSLARLAEATRKLKAERRERKRLEKALKETQNQFDACFQGAADGIFVADASGRYVDVNARGAEMIGYSREELLQRSIIDIVAEHERARVPAEVASVLDGHSQSSEWQFVRKDGSIFWGEVNAHLLSDGHAVGILRDITKRKQVEEALRESEDRFRSVLDNSIDAAYRRNLQTDTYDYLSPAVERILGFTPAEMKAQKIGDILARIHPDDLPALTREIENQSGCVLEYRFRTKDGAYRWLTDATKILADNKGRPLYRVGIVRDSTERKQAEADRLVLSKLESTGILAGGIAHDFNNLLTSILLNLSLAGSPVADEGDRQLCLNTVREAAVAASGLTKQLITFAQGGMPVQKLISLPEVIEGAARVALSGSAVQSELHLAKNLHLAQVDEQQIGQVIRNLLLNARDAMPHGGIVLVIAENVTLPFPGGPALAPGTYVRVSVTDSGCGIQPQVLPQIFDPYFSTKQRGMEKGMGLGLTICHSIIQKHGGTITVESTQGMGTTFSFYLSASTEPLAAPAEKKKPGASVRKRSGKILVMDDEHCMRLAVGSVLEAQGYQVGLTSHGQEAIDLYSHEKSLGKPFDAVILDLTVRGGMGGLETIRALLKTDPAVKALVMSGYSDDPVLLEPGRYGFKGAMEKSFDVDDLVAMLSHVML